MFSTVNAFARTFETKEEAKAYIEKAVEDPEILKYVHDNFGNATLFVKALNVIDDDKVINIANTFSDFQETGKDISFKDEEIKWIAVAMAGIILLIIIF
jgi:menaquinone-dependent protoporphyrinogen IX oxidase